MDQKGESTALTRELGAELRAARVKAGFTGLSLAHQLGWDQSKISRMETGVRGTSEVDAAIYLAYCKVGGKELNRLLDLAREADNGYRLRLHGSALPDELRSLIVQETTADVITAFELTRIPGLLQTEEYARALLTAGLAPRKEIESRVQARLERQSLLCRHKPSITFFIHEFALRLPVGGTMVMHEQCLKLLFDANRPQTAIRVIPSAVGAHAGTPGAFRIMQISGHKPVVYVENYTVSLFLEQRDDIDAYRRSVDALTAVALDEGQSRTLIAEVANEYDVPEGPQQ